MKSINYQRLSYLGDKVKAGLASKMEKDEFMLMLYQNGNITKLQYDDFVSGRNAENIINAALAVGAVVLLGYLLKELLGGK